MNNNPYIITVSALRYGSDSVFGDLSKTIHDNMVLLGFELKYSKSSPDLPWYALKLETLKDAVDMARRMDDYMRLMCKEFDCEWHSDHIEVRLNHKLIDWKNKGVNYE